jgi:hypothetical protein
VLSLAVKVLDLNMRVRLSRLRNGRRAVVSVMLEAIMHLTDALLLFRRLGVDARSLSASARPTDVAPQRVLLRFAPLGAGSRANPFDSGGNLGTQRSNSVKTV